MDEVELIRRHAPQVAPPDTGQKRRARLALIAAATVRGRRFSWPLARPRRTVLFALVIALVAIGLARAPFLLTPADPAAVAALQQAATVAAGGEALVIGDGYLYTKRDALWRFQGGDKFMYLRPVLREDWVAADGSGRIREAVGELIFLSEADRKAFLAGGFTVYALNEDFGRGELEPGYDVASFPTDVDGMREVVRHLTVPSDSRPFEAQMFLTIGDLLRDPLTPPAVRAGLYQVAAGLPGIELLGETTDRIGRPGMAVAMTMHQLQEVIVFDPTTSELLEERTVGLEPYGDTPAPITWGYTTYLEAKIVSEMPAE
jgi:hypothetical protein